MKTNISILTLLFCSLIATNAQAQILPENHLQYTCEGVGYFGLADTLNCNIEKYPIEDIGYWQNLRRRLFNPPPHLITLEKFQYDNYFKSSLERTFYLEIRKECYINANTHDTYDVFKITRASLRAHEIFGLSSEDLINTSFFCLLSIKGTKYFQDAFYDSLRGGKSFNDIFETDVLVRNQGAIQSLSRIEWIFLRTKEDMIFLQGTVLDI